MNDNNTYCNDLKTFGCVPVWPYSKDNITESLKNLIPAPEYIVTADGWLVKGAKNWQPVAKVETPGAYGFYYDNSTQKPFYSVFPLCPHKPTGDTEVRMLQIPPSRESSARSVSSKFTVCMVLVLLSWIM